MIISSVGLLLVLGIGWLLFYFITRPHACDWPMWRYDANRSASSPQKLPDKLYLQWMREYPKLTQAWENPLNRDLMQFDKVYEPVVHGKTLFIGSNASDKVVALDTETGEEKWEFYVDGPVRFPPVASNGKVYFVSDDGYLHCVDASLGKLIWKFRGGPSDRKILGNERLISNWPARGGPVLKDGIIYFAAGIWPFMGVFIYAIDAETGTVIWENDSTGAMYMLQPHNSPSYAGVAPQGNFVIAGDKLLIPGGRSMPACFDRHTGEFLYYHLARYNKTGGAFVSALGDFFINYHRDYVTSIYELSTGHSVISRFGKIPVMTENTLFSMGNPIIAYDFGNMKQVENEKVVIDKTNKEAKTVTDKKWVLEQLWKFNLDASGDLIKAGKRLYAGGKNVVAAIDLPGGRITKIFGRKEPKVSWKTTITGTATRIIAADNKLFVVTLEGSIYAFGGKELTSGPSKEGEGPKIYPHTLESSTLAKNVSIKAESILKTTGIKEGYCLAYGLETGDLVEALARKSNLRIIAVAPDPVKVDSLRRRFDALGLYGKRISVQVGDVLNFEVPPYLASLTLVENLAVEQTNSLLYFQKIYRSLRPYGGVACLPVSVDEISTVTQQIQSLSSNEVKESKLPNAKIREVEPVHYAQFPPLSPPLSPRMRGDERGDLLSEPPAMLKSEGYLLLIREGSLPGAADWTHQYGDIANTVKSDDELVKLPLGILWFGGSSNMDVLPRHGHGPPEQVIGGRLFIEGIDNLSARDVYTGRVLWKRTLDHLETYDVYYDETYKNTPLDPAYNQVHIPGANARGTNFVATLDKVYIAQKNSCLVLDAATGKTIEEIKLPLDPKHALERSEGTGQTPRWGYIGVYKDYLIAGAGFVHYLDFLDLDELGSNISKKRLAFYNFDITSSKKLVIMNRHTGKVLWTRNSELGFRHNAIAVGDDKIFCIDMIPPSVSDALDRRLGKYRFGKPKLIALNLHNGKTVWSTNENVFGTWLSYSKEYDILLQSGRQSRDMLKGEPTKGMIAYRGKGGAVLWSNDVSRGGPYILHRDTVITDKYAYSLLTGEQNMRVDPLTGEEKPWIFKRNYGCNYAIASEHLLTFRSAAAGFYDLEHDGGTGNFGGFRSSCTSNLLAANGVLNAPDYTRTCSCSYQNQTSLALVHVPDIEIWTTYFDENKTADIAASSSAIAFSDLEGKLAYVNNSFLKLWGYDDDAEVLGKSFVELWQRKDKWAEVLKTLSNKGRWIGEMASAKKDGSALDVHLLASIVTDESGKPVAMMISLVKSTDSAIAFSDLEGNLTYVNDSFLKLWGYSDDREILGKPFVELWQREDKASGVIETLRDKGTLIDEMVAMKKDGSTLNVHLSASMITDGSGKPVSVMASFVDITERKRVEEKVNDLKFGSSTIRNINQFITGNLPIRTIGINLGAPGDRRADNGTLWLEYPRVGGPSPDVPVSINPEKLLFSIDSKFQTDLDKKTLSEELRHQFANNGLALSKSATISIEKKNSRWLITKDNKKTYTIRKEKGKNIYLEDYDELNIYYEDYERYSHHSSRIQGEGLKWVVASGLKGVSSVTINLSGKSTEDTTPAEEVKPIEEPIQERPYTVRLYFAESDEIKSGQRVFNVSIQGREVLRNFDIVKEAGGPNRPVVKEFKEIWVKDDLTVAFTPSNDDKANIPLICGIKIMAEGW